MIDLYGYWPKFHDAEVVSISLKRELETNSASVIVVINYYETKSINEGTAEFEVVKDKDMLIILKFENLSSSSIKNFNHQNVIDELVLKKSDEGVVAQFISSYGVDMELVSNKVSVTKVSPK